jgi:hypothetical protein
MFTIVGTRDPRRRVTAADKPANSADPHLSSFCSPGVVGTFLRCFSDQFKFDS